MYQVMVTHHHGGYDCMSGEVVVWIIVGERGVKRVEVSEVRWGASYIVART